MKTASVPHGAVPAPAENQAAMALPGAWRAMPLPQCVWTYYVHDAPVSMRARAVRLLLVLTQRKAVYEREFSSGDFSANDVPRPPAAIASRCTIDEQQRDGRAVFVVAPRAHLPRGTLFYVHGGGFVHNMSRQHWDLVARLVDGCGWRVVVPDYPLAPEYTVDDALPLLEAAYEAACAQAGGLPVAVIGDSAGGNLALVLLQQRLLAGLPQPARLVLLSPWLDTAMAHPDIAGIAARDPMLQRAGLDRAARAFAGQHSFDDPCVSPIHGPVECLPPVDLFIGTDEIFHPDLIAFAQRLRLTGTPTALHEYPGMFHVWVALTGLPESRHAIARICAALRAHSDAVLPPERG